MRYTLSAQPGGDPTPAPTIVGGVGSGLVTKGGIILECGGLGRQEVLASRWKKHQKQFIGHLLSCLSRLLVQTAATSLSAGPVIKSLLRAPFDCLDITASWPTASLAT